MPLASVTSSVTVSPSSLPRWLRVYAISVPALSSIVVDEDDQRNVYGARPP